MTTEPAPDETPEPFRPAAWPDGGVEYLTRDGFTRTVFHEPDGTAETVKLWVRAADGMHAPATDDEIDEAVAARQLTVWVCGIRDDDTPCSPDLLHISPTCGWRTNPCFHGCSKSAGCVLCSGAVDLPPGWTAPVITGITQPHPAPELDDESVAGRTIGPAPDPDNPFTVPTWRATIDHEPASPGVSEHWVWEIFDALDDTAVIGGVEHNDPTELLRKIIDRHNEPG